MDGMRIVATRVALGAAAADSGGRSCDHIGLPGKVAVANSIGDVRVQRFDSFPCVD